MALTRIVDQTGNGHHFNDGGASTRPALTTGGPNSRRCADFDGTDDYMNTATDLSEFITNNAAYIIISLIIDAATDTDHAIIADSGQKIGIYFSSVNTPTIYVQNYDGTSDTVGQSALDLVMTVAMPLVLSWRHETGTVYLRINNGDEVSVASGNTSDLTGDLRIGMAIAGTVANIKIFEIATFDCAPPEGTRDAIEQDFMAWIGAETLDEVSDLPVLTEFAGVIATNAGNSASTNFTGIVLTFDSELIDTHNAHSTASNTSRITVPAELDGRYAVFHAFIYLTSAASGLSCHAYISSTGVQQTGLPSLMTRISNLNVTSVELSSAPIRLNTGDIFEVYLYSSDTALVLDAGSSFSMMIVG